MAASGSTFFSCRPAYQTTHQPWRPPRTATGCSRTSEVQVTTPFISPLAPFVDPAAWSSNRPKSTATSSSLRTWNRTEGHASAGMEVFPQLRDRMDEPGRDRRCHLQPALALNKVKMAHGSSPGRLSIRWKENSLFLRRRSQNRRSHGDGPAARERRIGELRIDVGKNISTIGEKDELEWRRAYWHEFF